MVKKCQKKDYLNAKRSGLSPSIISDNNVVMTMLLLLPSSKRLVFKYLLFSPYYSIILDTN